MTESGTPETPLRPTRRWSRRTVLRRGGVLGALTAVLAGGSTLAATGDGGALPDAIATMLQDHYRRMTPEEIQAALERIQRRAKRQYDVELECRNDPPVPGVVFGYAVNLSRCKGVRKCVEACVAENNQSRDPELQYIRVLELGVGESDLSRSEHYYDGEQVPRAGKTYLPVQCHQCDNPPCVKNCPVGATWKEPDGIVVVDYDWCIGCRYCMASCPYWARRFNWGDPTLPSDEINTRTHFLGNRPRPRGVVEKCTFCIQRTRRGRLPACAEACPTGARVFGNLLDPDSEIRYVLAHKKVFRLKEEVGTDPKFWYFTD